MAAKKSQDDSVEQPSFEDALRRLEEIVRLLEEGEIGLNEALTRYEEGVRLLRRSYDLLEHAERRIELLSGVDAEGNPVSRPFEELAGNSLDEKSQRRVERRSASSQPPDSGKKRPADFDTDVDSPEGLF